MAVVDLSQYEPTSPADLCLLTYHWPYYVNQGSSARPKRNEAAQQHGTLVIFRWDPSANLPFQDVILSMDRRCGRFQAYVTFPPSRLHCGLLGSSTALGSASAAASARWHALASAGWAGHCPAGRFRRSLRLKIPAGSMPIWQRKWQPPRDYKASYGGYCGSLRISPG